MPASMASVRPARWAVASSGLGVDVGANARLEFVLVGGEVAVTGLGGGAGNSAYVEGLGKAGIALTDNAVLYGAAGAGFSVGNTAEADVLAGGGLELAVADKVSLDARYLHGFPDLWGKSEGSIFDRRQLPLLAADHEFEASVATLWWSSLCCDESNACPRCRSVANGAQV